MGLLDNIDINLFSAALILVIYFQAIKSAEKNNIQYKLFIKLLQSTSLLLIIDILGRFDGNPNTIFPFINKFGNFAIFLLNPVIPSIWLLYVCCQIYENDDKIKKYYYPLYIINGFNVLMLLITQFTGWYYYIDSNNIYHRGPLFLVSSAITFVLAVYSFFLIFKNQKKIQRQYFFSLAFFAVPPFIGLILQTLFYGKSIVLNGVTLSLLIVFFNIQNHNLYTDYLTGINNRKKLEQYLKEKINTSHEKTFSAILIDLNNFKIINDTFGHAEGDKALQSVANLLKECLRDKDFIARFGGDEFCVVLDVSNTEDLESVVDRINASIEKYNKVSEKPYKLSFSMGYAIYDNKSNMNLEDFQNKIDMLMYKNKQSNNDLFNKKTI